MKREAGILLPIFSLPSRYGMGCFSKEAYRFVDFLAEAGQSYWQILPLSPTGFGDSPYQSFSAYALSPYLISPETLVEDGLLRSEECDAAGLESGDGRRVDYAAQYEKRFPLLRLAYGRARRENMDGFSEFEARCGDWLEDYACFMAIKQSFSQRPLSQWPAQLRLRSPQALSEACRGLGEEIGFWKFLQYYAARGWRELKAYANSRGIQMIGDLPIYVSADSADVWKNPELFQLDEQGIPLAVAGCPPDGFTPLGQLWGNPLYRWEVHRQSGFSWWIKRLSHAFSLYDVVRIDHFRGFDSYYSVPYGAENAVQGHWEQGPGLALFEAAERALGHRAVIAEDLGYMTDSVRRLVRDSGFPGMKILQFGFDGNHGDFSNGDLPHRYPEHCVAYTGTHDNPTLVEWLSALGEQELATLRQYLWDYSTPRDMLADPLIALLMRSSARLCIIPLQDYMGFGESARINRPSTASGNWSWRLTGEELCSPLAKKIRELCAPGERLV